MRLCDEQPHDVPLSMGTLNGKGVHVLCMVLGLTSRQERRWQSQWR